MQILRVFPQSFTVNINRGEEKIRRRIKRAKALRLSLGQGQVDIYYELGLKKRARDLGRAMGISTIYPMEEKVYKGPDSTQILVDYPEKLSQDILDKTNTIIEFDRPKAVLSQVDIQGNESIVWVSEASNWIFFAYPDEVLLPPRKGMGVSLQEILLPKIEEGTKKMQKNLAWYIMSPQEIEAVHQYRVSIRSFRALISMVKPLIKEDTYGLIQDIFRQKARQAARLRELDVLLEEWDQVRGPEEEDFRQALIRERREEQDHLLTILKEPKAEQEILFGVNQFISALEMSDWHSIDGIYFMDQRLHSWYRFTLEALWEMDSFDFPSVHKVRLKSKKYRYISEFFKDYITQTQQGYYKAAKKRQKVLGEVCDALRNQEAVEEILPKLDQDTVKEAEFFISKEGNREVDLLTSLGFVDQVQAAQMRKQEAQVPAQGVKNPEPIQVEEKPEPIEEGKEIDGAKEGESPLNLHGGQEDKKVGFKPVYGLILLGLCVAAYFLLK